MSGSLELAAKNLSTGSVKMMYALIYTLFLGFGLQIGNDIYFAIDPRARERLAALAARLVPQYEIVGRFAPDNGTLVHVNGGRPMNGTFTFYDVDPFTSEHIVTGCFRSPDFPWYLRPFPWWTQLFIVPIFSVLSSLANLQPLLSWDMVVMVVISCAAYTTNKIANSIIHNRSDFVSFSGAFVVGVLGAVWSRKMQGTAFTVMVTGVLFLVPVSIPFLSTIRSTDRMSFC